MYPMISLYFHYHYSNISLGKPVLGVIFTLHRVDGVLSLSETIRCVKH
jgi:hypothetical protein